MRILIATGGSDYSYLAVKRACEMVVNAAESEIRIISVYRDIREDSPEPLELASEPIRNLENLERLQSTEFALKAVQIIKDHFPGTDLKLSMTAVRGSAAKMIIDEAVNWNADLVVVGSLGHSFLSRLFIGSVSEEIVRKASCSVLVVRGNLREEAEKD